MRSPTRRDAAIRVVLFLLLSITLTPTASAQSSSFGTPLGWLSVSADNTSYDPDIQAQPFVPFHVFLVADLDYGDIGRPELNSSTGIQAWEAGLDIPGLGSDLIITGKVIRNGGVELGDQTNNIIGLYSAILADQTPIDLVDYTVLSLVAGGLQDVRLTLGPSTPSSFSPERPGMADNIPVDECTNPVTGEPTSCLRAFANTSPAVINCVNDCIEPPFDERLVVNLGVGRVPTNDVGIISVTARVAEVVGVLIKDNPRDLAGLDLSLQWDASLMSLSEVRTTDATAGWELQSNIGEGTVEISAAGSQGLFLDEDSRPILDLVFVGGSDPGTTSITAASTSFYDSQPAAIEAFVQPGGVEVIPCDLYDPFDDDVVNSADAIVALKIVTGQIFPTTETFCAADVDRNDQVDVGDVIRILRRAVGLEKVPVTVATPSRVELDRDGSVVVLRVDGAAGIEGELLYDPTVLRVADEIDGAEEALVSVNTTEDGRVRFALASTSPLDTRLRVRFESVGESSVGVVRLGETTGFAADGTRVETERGQSEVALRQGIPSARGTRLVAAVPNPFNPKTEIRLHLDEPADLRLRIYDAAGRQVRTLDRRGLGAGEQAIAWNGLDDTGRPVASGVYFVRMQAGATSDGLRVVLLK